MQKEFPGQLGGRAYGCAYSGEAESAHAVYSLADERMYEHKRLSKMGRQA
ncbi:MAG: hypothetical protein MR016_01995 [Agathobacter sp.]|nr:hypothetical protein [Agathobacter sp.]